MTSHVQVIWRVPYALRLGMLVLLTASPATPALGQSFPPLIGLPDGFAPEGIATGRGSTVYMGNLAGGDLLKADLRTGEVRPLAPSPGAGAEAVGLKVDLRTNYLFVAGGTAGARIYDAATGALLQSYAFTPRGDYPVVLINDVAITRDAAYFTDSCSDTIYKLPLGPGGRLPGAGAVEAIVLTDFPFVEIPLGPDYPCGLPNMNGIVATSDGKWLIVNNTATGAVYRVDPATGASVQIRTADGSPVISTFTDGLLLHGTTLYSVENFLNQIAVIELSRDLLTGSVTRYITSPHFDVPATAAFFGGAIYAVNARFRFPGQPPAGPVDDDIVRVER